MVSVPSVVHTEATQRSGITSETGTREIVLDVNARSEWVTWTAVAGVYICQ